MSNEYIKVCEFMLLCVYKLGGLMRIHSGFHPFGT